MKVIGIASLILAGALGAGELPLIGFTKLRTNLPGGRHANVQTQRAMVMRAGGGEQREVGAELIKGPNQWTQFGSWSPDGEHAVIGVGWQDPENAKWEEAHKRFRMEPGKWRYDGWIWKAETGNFTDVCSVDRVSHYNGVSFASNGEKLLMTSLTAGTSKPFLMNLDGRDKTDVSGGTGGFTYGFNASPDGKRICYHENYQVYLANADGSAKKKVETGNSFNFGPTWSPDGQWLLFVSGEHYNCHPHVVRADGTGLRKLAERNGYRGVTLFLDVPDFHQGSSDTAVWAVDSKSVFYCAKVGEMIELFRVGLDGTKNRLTRSEAGTTHYHARPSPDGRFLLYGSKRKGVRQLLVRALATGKERQLTHLSRGHAAMWAHWQPRPTSKKSR